MIEIRRAADRSTSGSAGITSWHCFSAGDHYDADNLAFGPLIGVDEHLLSASAGFARHRHRGVEISSVVLAGELRHTDGDGRVQLVGPGHVLRQSDAGEGIEHAEANASADRSLRLIQITELVPGPSAGPAAVVARHDGPAVFDAGLIHLLVVAGPVELGSDRLGPDRLGPDRLGPGDSVRATERVRIGGRGTVISWVASVHPA